MLTRSPLVHTLLPGVLGRTCFCHLTPSCKPASWRKQLTSGSNSSSGSRLKSRKGSLASSSSPDPGPHSSWPQVMDQLSLSIFSSKAAAVARPLQWASLTLVRSLLVEVSLLPLLGVLLLGGWMSARPGSSKPHSGLPSCCPRQSFREDTISAASFSIHSSPHSGDPGSLLSLYTW